MRDPMSYLQCAISDLMVLQTAELPPDARQEVADALTKLKGIRFALSGE